MKEIESLANQYVAEAFQDPADSFAEKCSALSGFKEGFRKAREMVVAELMSIAAQTDDMGIIYLRDQFLKLGESEAKE